MQSSSTLVEEQSVSQSMPMCPCPCPIPKTPDAIQKPTDMSCPFGDIQNSNAYPSRFMQKIQNNSSHLSQIPKILLSSRSRLGVLVAILLLLAGVSKFLPSPSSHELAAHLLVHLLQILHLFA
jgi:hypothetical protein